MGQLIYTQGKHIGKDVKACRFIRVGPLAVPSYLSNWQDSVGCTLMILLVNMLCMKPIVHFLGKDGPIFNEHCEEAERLLFAYSIALGVALLCYYLLLVDLAVFSRRISAFVQVCGRLLSEVSLFLFGVSFFVVAFACAISSLEQDGSDFAGIPLSAVVLLKVTLGMLGVIHYDAMHVYPAVFVAVVLYIVVTVVFLLNLLIAQLNCAYQSTFLDMIGYACLNRGKIVTETLPSVSKSRWQHFVASLWSSEKANWESPAACRCSRGDDPALRGFDFHGGAVSRGDGRRQ